MSNIDQLLRNPEAHAGAITAPLWLRPVTESVARSRPTQWKHRVLLPTIPDRDRAPSLFTLPNTDDAGARFNGSDWFRTAVVRMPQMRSR
jgi:hypothetical protein